MEPFDAYARSKFGSGFQTTTSKILSDEGGVYTTEDGRRINANATDIPLDKEIFLVTCETPKGLYVVDWALVDDPRIYE